MNSAIKLYEEGADEMLAKAMQSAPDLAKGLSEQAQMMLQMVDGATEGAVPDELYMMMGIEIMSELADVGKAFGLEINGRVVATAMQDFLSGVIEGLGGDPSQLRDAMSQVNVDEVGSALDQNAQEG